jgi:hypothetical protein
VLERNFFFPRLFVFLAGLFVVAAVGFSFAFFLVTANVLSRNTNDCLDHPREAADGGSLAPGK